MAPRIKNPYPLSVSSYSEALRFLWHYAKPESWCFDDAAPLPLEAQLICAIYWVSEKSLRHDLQDDWNKALAPEAPVRPAFKKGERVSCLF